MKIAIVKLSALGDIIHSMIVLQYIKNINPEIEVDWFVEEAFKGILEFNPDIRNVHTVNIKKAKRKKSSATRSSEEILSARSPRRSSKVPKNGKRSTGQTKRSSDAIQTSSSLDKNSKSLSALVERRAKLPVSKS